MDVTESAALDVARQMTYISSVTVTDRVMRATVMSMVQLRWAAAAHHGTIETDQDGGRCYTIYAVAPAGYVWAASGTHQMVESSFRGPASWSAETRAELAARIAMGVYPCEQVDCDYCEEAR